MLLSSSRAHSPQHLLRIVEMCSCHCKSQVVHRVGERTTKMPNTLGELWENKITNTPTEVLTIGVVRKRGTGLPRVRVCPLQTGTAATAMAISTS